MKIKTKILLFSFMFYILYGIISGILLGKIQNNIFEAIYAIGTLILFFIWLYYDSIEYDYPVSTLFKVSIIFFVIPIFWYIFKTRKLKKGLLFILKSIGIILLLMVSFVIPHLIILSIRGIKV